jgi:hypothetical protein
MTEAHGGIGKRAKKGRRREAPEERRAGDGLDAVWALIGKDGSDNGWK